MRRVLLMIALAASGLVSLAPAAQADDLADAKAYFRQASARYDTAWEKWSVAYVCVMNTDSVTGTMIYEPADDEQDPAEWLAVGDQFNAEADSCLAAYRPLWRKMTRPHCRALWKWRALAQWVEHYSPRSKNTVADARKLLRVLRTHYGDHPRLAWPLGTMRRLSRTHGL